MTVKASQYASGGDSYFIIETSMASGAVQWIASGGSLLANNNFQTVDDAGTVAQSDVSLAAIAVHPESEYPWAAVSPYNNLLKGDNRVYGVGVGAPFTGKLLTSPGRPQLMRIDPSLPNGPFGTFVDSVAFWDTAPAGGFSASKYKPTCKLACYLDAPNSLPMTRNPVTRAVAASGLSGAANDLIANIPFYGRSYLAVDILQTGAHAGTFTVTVNGIYIYGPGASDYYTIPLTTTVAIGTGAAASFQMANRFFDAIQLTATGAVPNAANFLYAVTTADKAP